VTERSAFSRHSSNSCATVVSAKRAQ